MMTFTIAGEGEPYDAARSRVADAALAAAYQRLARAMKAPGGREKGRAAGAVERATIAGYEAQPNVFAFTVVRARLAMDAMCHLGMLDLDSRPGPEPDPDDFGVTDAMIEAWYAAGEADEDGWEEPREMALYSDAMRRFWDLQPMPNPDGIPAYKLRSAPWLITPDEITAALGAYHTALGVAPAPPMFWWTHWIAFLGRAAGHLGARVGTR